MTDLATWLLLLVLLWEDGGGLWNSGLEKLSVQSLNELMWELGNKDIKRNADDGG